jgi:hypothetical protein
MYPLKYDANTKTLKVDLSKINKGTTVLGNPGGGLDTAFKYVEVSGQNGLTSIQYVAETLRFVAGPNIILTTDSAANSITIASTATGGGGSGSSPIGNYVSTFNGLTGDVRGITQAAGTTFGAIQYRDFAVGATGLSASNQFVWGSEGLWVYNNVTITGSSSFLKFSDGTTQSTAYLPNLITQLQNLIDGLSSDNYYFKMGDLNRDGVIDSGDLGLLLGNWGTVPPPGSAPNFNFGSVQDNSLYPPTTRMNQVKSLVVYNKGSRNYNSISADDLLSDLPRTVNGLTGDITISGYKFTSGTAAPTGASAGDRWLQQNTGILYTYIPSGANLIWVQV